MTDGIRLFTGPLSMFGMKSEIALREKGLPFDRVEVAYSAADGYHPRHPEVIRINPKQQVPVLTDGDVEIFDSTQIFEYLEDIAPQPPLWPSEPRQRARARLLEHQSDEVYFPHVVKLMGLQGRLEAPEAAAAIAAIQACSAALEQQIGDQSYLCGDYSYADIAFFMVQVFAERMGAPLTDATPKLKVWRRRMVGRPAVRPVMASLVDYLQKNQRPVPEYLNAATGD
jgi:glutathione S-transferase